MAINSIANCTCGILHSRASYRELEAHVCAHGCGSDAMLAGPCLCNQSFLPQPLGNECLPDSVVNLVSPRVVQVFALEPDTRSSYTIEVMNVR